VPGLSPRELPSVDRLLQDPLLRDLPRAVTVDAAREVLEEARRGTRNGGWPHTLEELPALVARRVEDVTLPKLRAVINATGVVIHTNLGRGARRRGGGAAAGKAPHGG
jgi:L-seryl-tRNA(Ser) seleniumtransferase